MHNIKDLRKNLQDFKRKLKDRNFDLELDKLVLTKFINSWLLSKSVNTLFTSESM